MSDQRLDKSGVQYLWNKIKSMFALKTDVPSASTVTPGMDSVSGQIGASTNYARADHTHPKDSSKANVASPNLTGTPTAPTAAVGTSSTQIATTAFVNNVLADFNTSQMNKKQNLLEAGRNIALTDLPNGNTRIDGVDMTSMWEEVNGKVDNIIGGNHITVSKTGNTYTINGEAGGGGLEYWVEDTNKIYRKTTETIQGWDCDDEYKHGQFQIVNPVSNWVQKNNTNSACCAWYSFGGNTYPMVISTNQADATVFLVFSHDYVRSFTKNGVTLYYSFMEYTSLWGDCTINGDVPPYLGDFTEKYHELNDDSSATQDYVRDLLLELSHFCTTKVQYSGIGGNNSDYVAWGGDYYSVGASNPSPSDMPFYVDTNGIVEAKDYRIDGESIVKKNISDLQDVEIDDVEDGDTLIYNATTQKWENGSGGGTANAEEMTYAEYEALSQAEKEDGTIRFITDYPDSGGGGSDSSIDYSTTEQVVGTWVDGKPLYRKSFVFSASDVSNNNMITDLLAADIDSVWLDLQGTFVRTQDSSGIYFTSTNYWNPANTYGFRIDVTYSQYVVIWQWKNGAMAYSGNSVFSFLYTKVAD